MAFGRFYRSTKSGYMIFKEKAGDRYYVDFGDHGTKYFDKEPSDKDVDKKAKQLSKAESDRIKAETKDNKEKLLKKLGKPKAKDWKEFEERMKAHDWHSMISSDHQIFKKGSAERSWIERQKWWLSHHDEKKAGALYKKHAPKKEGAAAAALKKIKKALKIDEIVEKHTK